MNKLETIREKKGYMFSDGSGGKSWKRGKIKYSTGRYYYNGIDSYACITKTNLDTYKVEVASLEEHKRFLTPECYKKYVEERFVQMSKKG